MVSKYFLLLLVSLAIIPFLYDFSSDGRPQIAQCQSSQQSVSNQISERDELYDSLLSNSATSIGSLPLITSSGIQSFEQYKELADTMNDGAKILNAGFEHQIPFLEDTLEGYDKASKIIVKYAPLIGSYNDMVNAARNVDVSNPDSATCFYIQTGIFSLELTLISTAVYAGPAYVIVGNAYRASGLQFIAFKCPSCVSTVLSHAHWFVRTTFVEGTVATLTVTLNEINNLLPEIPIPEFKPNEYRIIHS